MDKESIMILSISLHNDYFQPFFGKEEVARLARLATFEILAFRIVHQTICCLAMA